VTAHRPNRREIADLLAVADRDLEQCRDPGLHPDWRLAIAYNAALQCATAALAAVGYRAAHEAHHHRVVQSLELTIGWPRAEVDALDTFRGRRNVVEYRRADVVSDAEANEMVQLARKLRADVQAWLAAQHSDLLSE
jgi:hypothetical protein